jgi:hypothetical protein
MSLVYVLCRVRPNTRDEVKDEMCEDVPVTTPTLAVLISNRHIQAMSVILDTPSHLPNLHLNHSLSTPFPMLVHVGNLLNFVDCWWLVKYVNYVDCRWILKYVLCELCRLVCELLMLLILNLSCCCWYVCQLMICQPVYGLDVSRKKWKKLIPRSIAPARVAR